MKLFLTSSPIGIYRSDEQLNYAGFNPANGMVAELKRFWADNARCLLISAFHDDHELNDRMREDYENIVRDTGLPLSCMDICDSRNGEEKAAAADGFGDPGGAAGSGKPSEDQNNWQPIRQRRTVCRS